MINSLYKISLSEINIDKKRETLVDFSRSKNYLLLNKGCINLLRSRVMLWEHEPEIFKWFLYFVMGDRWIPGTYIIDEWTYFKFRQAINRACNNGSGYLAGIDYSRLKYLEHKLDRLKIDWRKEIIVYGCEFSN